MSEPDAGLVLFKMHMNEPGFQSVEVPDHDDVGEFFQTARIAAAAHVDFQTVTGLAAESSQRDAKFRKRFEAADKSVWGDAKKTAAVNPWGGSAPLHKRATGATPRIVKTEKFKEGDEWFVRGLDARGEIVSVRLAE